MCKSWSEPESTSVQKKQVLASVAEGFQEEDFIFLKFMWKKLSEHAIKKNNNTLLIPYSNQEKFNKRLFFFAAYCLWGVKHTTNVFINMFSKCAILYG